MPKPFIQVAVGFDETGTENIMLTAMCGDAHHAINFRRDDTCTPECLAAAFRMLADMFDPNSHTEDMKLLREYLARETTTV